MQTIDSIISRKLEAFEASMNLTWLLFNASAILLGIVLCFLVLAALYGSSILVGILTLSSITLGFGVFYLWWLISLAHDRIQVIWKEQDIHRQNLSYAKLIHPLIEKQRHIILWAFSFVFGAMFFFSAVFVALF